MQTTWQETRARLKQDKKRLLSIAMQEGVNGFNWPSSSWRIVFHPSYQCVVLHRLSHFFYSNGYRSLARLLWHANLVITGADITPNTNIAGGLLIKAPMRVTMVGHAGENLTLEGHGGFGGGRSPEDIGAGPGLPILGNNVSIGYGSMALGPIRIGNNVTFEPRANVSKHIADNTRIKLVQKQHLSTLATPSEKNSPQTVIANDNPNPATLSLRQLIALDVKQYIKYSSAFSGDGAGLLRKLSAILTPSVTCVILYRLSHKVHNWRLPLLAMMIAKLNFLLHRASISPASRIGPGLYIPHTPGVTFHGTAGQNLVLYYHAIVTARATHLSKTKLYWDCPTLGDNITIASSATVLGAIHIGDNCVIGMNCAIKESLAANTSVICRETSKHQKQTELSDSTPDKTEFKLKTTAVTKISWRETWRRLKADQEKLRLYYQLDGVNSPFYLSLTRSFQSIFFYRLSHYFLGKQRFLLARVCWYSNLWLTGADINPRSQIGEGLVIDNPVGINIEAIIGDNCTFSEGASVMLDRTNEEIIDTNKLPVIGSNVRLEAGAIIIGSIAIGDNSIIGSKCCISNNIEAQSLTATPANINKRNRLKNEPSSQTANSNFSASYQP